MSTFYTAHRDGRVVARELTLEEVSEMLQLEPSEVLWSLEEFGRCDGLDRLGRELGVRRED